MRKLLALTNMNESIQNSFGAPPNGLRYPLVGGTRQRRFAGTSFKPRKLPKPHAANGMPPRQSWRSPRGRVHALLGDLIEFQFRLTEQKPRNQPRYFGRAQCAIGLPATEKCL